MPSDLTVIEGGASDGRPPVTRSRSREHFCAHLHAVTHPERRKVTCDDCGAELDPFDFLEKLAHGIDRWTSARDMARREARQAQAELAEVKRELRNAKARLRRATRGT